jgi:hypothetical protein
VRLAALFRLTALGIALLCWLDPASSISGPPPVLVDAAIVRSARDARPARSEAPLTVLDRAREVAAGLADALGRDGTVRVHEVAAEAPLPCDAVQPCVVLTEGAPLAIPPDRKGPVTFVPLGGPLANNVDITRLVADPAHLEGQGTARVTLDGQGLKGRVTRVRLEDGAALVGEATHAWNGDGPVEVDVPWIPVSAGTRKLTARAETEGDAEATALDNDVTAAVEITAERWPVVVFERRPSWSATFVRRALEQDRRVEMTAHTDIAPRVTVAATASVLDGEHLDRARVVLVGAPEALTAADVTRLEAFVRDRGGAVVLLPDRRLDGPVTRLLHHPWHERIDDRPTSAGGMLASEWLVAGNLTPLDRVWAESMHGPVVVSTPAGNGIVLVSGALDAWRHRGEDQAFERFWRATVAGLASAVGDAVDVDLVMMAPHAGGDLEARVRARSVRERASWRAAAIRTCDDGESVAIRLWPADAAGAFSGRVPIDARRGCQVTATVAGLGEATASVADGGARGSSHRWTPEDMEALAGRTGGAVVTEDNVRSIVQGWLDKRGTERRPETRYPMRSWWWLLPFAGCLTAEWWLRRRAGLR